MSSDQRLKKLRGSGGYVLANIGDDLQQKGNLGGPDLFLAPIGRLPESSVSSYHCNVCEKDYEGCPKIDYESPNETVADNLVLVERGQYMCTTCDSPIAEYRVFRKPEDNIDVGLAKTVSEIAPPNDMLMPPIPNELPQASDTTTESTTAPVSISTIAGMTIYDERAFKIGTACEVGVDPATNTLVLTVESNDGQVTSVPWNRVSKVGEIIILGGSSCCGQTPQSSQSSQGACSSCGFSNKPDSKFCEQCGNQT